jgi:CubicO group peptidase (beta-lactamase class C family)
LEIDVTEHMASQRVAGIIIVHDNRIRLEEYGLGFDARSRWTSFSVAKSFTSTLVGAAIRDGYIKSLDDKVTAYIKDLKGSAYDDVTVKQLLTMTSGVKWNEDYTDPKSDVAVFLSHAPDAGMNATVSYMRRLPREAPPGSKWVYKTGETNLIGILVSQAVHKSLSVYLSEKIWKPYGMEADAFWLMDSTSHEISGCCISARLRDYARFGQFIVDGGGSVLPKDWLDQATVKQADIGVPGRGYGYQWWTEDDGIFSAYGIFGQSIFIDRKRKLVMVTNGNWPTATDRKVLQPARTAFFRRVQALIDGER